MLYIYVQNHKKQNLLHAVLHTAVCLCSSDINYRKDDTESEKNTSVWKDVVYCVQKLDLAVRCGEQTGS